MRQVVVVLIASIATAGCGSTYFTDRKANPVIKETVGPVIDFSGKGTDTGVLGLTPERRLTIFKQTDTIDGRLFCSEPSPDVAEALATLFTLDLQAQVQGQAGATGSGELGLNKALAADPRQLFARTQGLQFYRDRSFQLCQMYLNGVFGPLNSPDALVSYIKKDDQLAMATERMIRDELSKKPVTQPTPDNGDNALAQLKEIAAMVKDLTPPPTNVTVE